MKTVGIGFIGTGFARKVQMPAFAGCDGANIVSIASGTLDNAKAAAEEFSAGHFTSDWRETAARDDVDLVCITTPPVMHREMALFAIEHGKHVLCEKPMAMNAAEAAEMAAAAKGAGVLALIDHELRFQPGRIVARQILLGGELGKIRNASYTFQAPHRGDRDIPWNWWSDVEAGGGALGAINSHIIDSFHHLLGTEVSSVFCVLSTNVKQRRTGDGEMRAVTTDDEANMLLRFKDSATTAGATGVVAVSMTDGVGYTNRVEIYGEAGALRVDHRGDLYRAKRNDTEWTAVDVRLGSPIDGVGDTGFSRGFMEFAPKIIEAVRAGASTVDGAADFEDGLRVQRVLDAARRSDETGTAVDPQAT
jgi:predicted dehydrogenase